MSKIKLHWDEYNPWRNEIIYVPLEKLAEALDDGGMIQCLDGTIRPFDAAHHLEHWHQCGRNKLDAYVLIENWASLHRFSAGVRFGKRGEEYYSPYVSEKSAIKIEKMLQEVVPEEYRRVQLKKLSRKFS